MRITSFAGTSAKFMPQPDRAEAVTPRRLVWPVLSGVVLVALIAAAAILLSYKIEPPPDHARVIADEQRLTYASEKTIADIKADGKWSRDTACDYITGFDQIVTVWMRLIGYRSRWTDDGQWRW